ncbi:hypothetical protein QMZ05_39530, partial [Bradyrhizobium sp. INPA03-11B]
QDIESIPIGDVLSIYLDTEPAKLRDRFKVTEDDEETIACIRKFKKRIGRLNDWWGAKMLSEIDGEQCRRFARERGNKGGSRRDLEDLRAAINHHAIEGDHRGIVKVTLPDLLSSKASRLRTARSGRTSTQSGAYAVILLCSTKRLSVRARLSLFRSILDSAARSHKGDSLFEPGDRRVDIEICQLVSSPEVDDMFLHPGSCVGGVAPAECLQYLFMSKDKAFSGIQAREHVQERWIEQLAHRLAAELQCAIARRARYDLMKFNVELDQAPFVFKGRFGLIDVGLQGCQQIIVNSIGGADGKGRLEKAHTLPELEEGDLMEYNGGCHLVRNVGLTRRGDVEKLAPVLATDETVLLQDSDRLPHR